MSPDSVLNFIRPPEDMTHKAVRRWHWNVAIVLFALIGFTAFALSPMGFAREPSVDTKISAAKIEISGKIDAVTVEQKAQGQQLANVSKLLTEQLASTVSSQIRLNISKRCKTTGAVEREELNRERERLQDEYRGYKGDYYREPTCAEL